MNLVDWLTEKEIFLWTTEVTKQWLFADWPVFITLGQALITLLLDWLVTEKKQRSLWVNSFLVEFDLTHYELGELSFDSFGLYDLRVWFNSFCIQVFPTPASFQTELWSAAGVVFSTLIRT